ncbi:uncharacterized protein F5891DRAFT_371966 [Suillus fuscotomentosus]|uniref:Fungal-type protein kinase domain-containing protein n=1 Tax=Suillus fuscotomentosus TaxID=1912939 RepID=A0AAD4EJN1_9AGAM|nr:uncharacterized protein F5891DRAFT_371966 [Suillus fuscotomentosus]KAG1907433.1 hypothetical protein F5891DRAFT_371966 [Suillus fuscotomentosus]
MSSKDTIEAKLVGTFPGRFIGAMPVRQFLNFLPEADGRPIMPNVVSLEELLTGLPKFTTNFDLVDTSGCPDPSVVVGGYEFQPTMGLYKGESTRNGVTDMSAMEAWIIIKPSVQQDPFIDPPPNEDFTAPIPCPEEDLLPYWDTKRDTYPRFESTDKRSISTRAHMVACTNAFFATQFRRFGFSILLCGSWARFVYWDHSGAVVSRQFRYTSNFNLLAEFLWRLNRASPGNRGVDVSVVPVSLPESQDSVVRELLGVESSDPLYGYIVPVDTTLPNSKDSKDQPSSTHHFYVGPRPASKQCSLLEQRARSFHVWDLTQKRIVFFKETWRLHAKGTRTESEVYRELHTRRIPNIPTLEHGGDMSALGTKTITHLFGKAWWCCTPNHKAHLPLVQHRIILSGVERNLSTFKTPMEFLTVFKDALTAHNEAYERGGLLHRNISMENIGITNEGRGLLMGWECCSSKSHEELLAIQMGTLPFMSGALLDQRSENKHHVLADDLESFLHVMVYTIVRYLPSTMNTEHRNTLLQIFDEEYVIDKEGRAIGGSRKRKWLDDPERHVLRKFPAPPDIAMLLRQLCELFPIRYNFTMQVIERHTYDTRFKTPSDLLASHQEMMRYVGFSVLSDDGCSDMDICDF